jgi:hypothetical protein
MDFFTFWRRVAVVALKHTLDLAQTVIFILFLGAGGSARLLPQLSPMTQAISGWEFAAILFGGIVFVRLFVLGPYWVWKEQKERAEAAEKALAAQHQAEQDKFSPSAEFAREVERRKIKLLAEHMIPLASDRREDDYASRFGLTTTPAPSSRRARTKREKPPG